MNLVSHLRTALEVLLQHRVRSGLTVMGITIGISSTVVMLALGRGVQDQIEQSFSRAGVTLLTVIARTPPGVPESTRSRELHWRITRHWWLPAGFPTWWMPYRLPVP